MVDQQTYYSQPPYDRTQTHQRHVQQVQYIQYVSQNDCNIEAIQQSFNKQQNQIVRSHPHQEGQLQNGEVIRIESYEPPMMLNAWTQTNSDDFPPLTNKNNEAALLENIKELEQKLKYQSEIINKMNQSKALTSTPVRIISQKTLTPPETIPVEYRIINKMNGPNNETQIEIEISDDNTQDVKEESSDTVNVDQKENSMVEHMYAQIAKTPISKAQQKSRKSEGPLVSIGPNDTKVPAAEFEKLTWSSASIATRKLLGFIFDRETLATHSMTGKASPAFKDLDKPVKRKLDSKAIEDVIFVVTKKCGVSAKEVRSAITTKCADENKMLKLKALKNVDGKRQVLTDINQKQNI
ncbi:protein insensitive-like isoform X2 [Eupeodes corollae]|nr:protein insensitive-like isoform X2 [Eupeodes corollae]XP_055919990.1 protein insensitive-like isoform X2 [Eupeodes corollae]